MTSRKSSPKAWWKASYWSEQTAQISLFPKVQEVILIMYNIFSGFKATSCHVCCYGPNISMFFNFQVTIGIITPSNPSQIVFRYYVFLLLLLRRMICSSFPGSCGYFIILFVFCLFLTSHWLLKETSSIYLQTLLKIRPLNIASTIMAGRPVQTQITIPKRANQSPCFCLKVNRGWP